MDDFDAFAKKLQEQIFEEAKRLYGERGFNRWLNIKYMGVIENPDGHARIKGKCGDSIEIFLKFEKEKVKDAKFITDGCASSTICGSFAVELAIGKTPDEIVQITAEQIIKEIGGLPEEE